MKAFKERLEIFAKTQYNMGQTRFEDYCEVSHGTVSAIRASGPSASVVTRIAVKCPELNLNWLFTGEGEMLNSAPTVKTGVATTSGPLIQNVFVTNFADLKDVMVEAIKESRQ